MCFGLFPCCWVLGFSGGSVMWVLFVALVFFFFGAFRRSLLYPGVIELCFKLALFDKYNITYQKNFFKTL
jgi:hypothetical protein